MNWSDEELKSLRVQAERAALTAGQHIATVDRRKLVVERKTSGHSVASQVVTELDRHCELMIRQQLPSSLPGKSIAWLGEETIGDGDQANHLRFSADAFWCVDPLDGTDAFVSGRSGYAVAIALVSRDAEILLGVVYDPVKQQIYSKARGAPTDVAPLQQGDGCLHWYLDASLRSMPDFHLLQTAIVRWAELSKYGKVEEHIGAGAVLNACAVLQQADSFYLKLPKPQQGGGCIWDYAATTALFNGTGKPVTDAFGRMLPLNRHNLFFNDIGVLFASDHSLHAEILALIQSFPRP